MRHIDEIQIAGTAILLCGARLHFLCTIKKKLLTL